MTACHKWWTKKSHEIQHLAEIGDTRGFVKATKAIYGPSFHWSNSRWSKVKQKILKTEEDIKVCCEEQFKDLLNQRTMVDEEVLNKISQYSLKKGMGVPPSLRWHLSNAQQQGYCSWCEVNFHDHIHDLIMKIWDKEVIPAAPRNALNVSLFKKGDEADFESHFCPPERSSPAFSARDSSSDLRRSSLNLNVAFILLMVQLLSSQRDSCKKNSKDKRKHYI